MCQKISTLIEEYKSGGIRSSAADELFFSTFLDYADKNKIPRNFLIEWKSAKRWFGGYAHLREPPFRAETDSELAKHFNCLDGYLYIAASSQYERLKALNEILDAPTDEMIDKALSSVKKATDRLYFFSRLNNPLWVGPLRERGYFENPPGKIQLPDGYVQYPHWPEFSYLVTVAGEATDQIIDIVLALPKTDNPRVYDDILEIALSLEGRESAKLLPKIVEYTELDNQFLVQRYPEILQHWTNQGHINEALELVKRLIPFREDPRLRAKQRRRREDPSDLYTVLEPAPRFDVWEYQQIIEKGVHPLAEKEPYQVALILINATADMVRMEFYPEDLVKVRDIDYSEIWCRRLDTSDRDYHDAKEILVHTLTYACEQVYDKASESIEALDQVLRKQRWNIFKRLRQYLYAQNPKDLTLPWIRQLLIGHEDYSKEEHNYEFQLMIRKACEHFSLRLLSDTERKAIFDAILGGPSKEDYREWMGDRYSDEAFQQHQRYFHHMQLRPFKALLSGKYQDYFNELENDAREEFISDESYLPYKIGRRRCCHLSKSKVR